MLFEDLDLRIASMFSGAEEFRELVETFTSINVRQLRVADFAMEIPAPRKGRFQDCPTQINREKAMFHFASERFANDEVNRQRPRALDEAMGAPADSPIENKSAYTWTCPVVLEDNTTCVKEFSSTKSLAQPHAHGAQYYICVSRSMCHKRVPVLSECVSFQLARFTACASIHQPWLL